MKTKILTAALMAGLVMTAAAAQEGRKRPDFSAMDTDGDGSITLAEIEARSADRFTQTDTDGDGAFSAEELIAAAEGRNAERATRMLERFDENEDGLLQQAELPQRDGDRAARMFERVDADGDGMITQAEFDAAQETMGNRERRTDRG
ncbi:calcium-binding protein [Yoonia sp. BS5-3]|uniref:EF-hand domain-containing protein n=1 Tax=Yoonia phaeophyticola TaxID=3137369 RepID=A0ABZ2VBY0_9RHOB